jgi:hypothetical protein
VRTNWHLNGAGAGVSGDWKKEAQGAARAWARANGYNDLIWDDTERKGDVPRGRRADGVLGLLGGRDSDLQVVRHRRPRRRPSRRPRFQPSMLSDEARAKRDYDRDTERQMRWWAASDARTARGNIFDEEGEGRDGGWARGHGAKKASILLARRLARD